MDETGTKTHVARFEPRDRRRVLGAAARERRPTRRSQPARSSATSPTPRAAVPAAQVTATQVGTQFARTATTDADGEYALRLLPVGNYKADVALDGFKNFSQTGILLEVGRNARVDATIEPGAIAETVSVVGDAPLVETTSSSLSRTVGQNEVLNLPLVNRDLYSLLSLTGGVSSNESAAILCGGPEQLTTVNGSGRAQMGSVNFQLDGGNNTAGLRGTGNPAPNPEAVQEFRVITNGYAAEIRALPGRRRGRRHEVGNEPVSRRRLRVLPQREAEREALGASRHDGGQGPARPESVRSSHRRADKEGQDLLLRQLLRFAAGRDLLSQHRRRAHGPRARGRLLPVGAKAARSRDRASRSRNIIPSHASTLRPGPFRTDSFRSRTCPNNFYEVSRRRSAQHRRGHGEARPQPLLNAHRSR